MGTQLYYYEGPVYYFGSCVNNKWTGTTRAVSEEKARSNLTFRYKKDNNLVANSRIILPEKLIVLKENY